MLLLIGNSAAELISECEDRNYISKNADSIVEGTVEKVESKQMKEKFGMSEINIYTFNNLTIEKYVMGNPINRNKVQLVIPGGTVNGITQWVEDQPTFHEGARVRVYLQEEQGKFSVVCAQAGVEEIIMNGKDKDGTARVQDFRGGVPVEWEKTFGGTGYDYAFSVDQTQDEGFIIAGSTTSYGAGNQDAWIIKTDPKGNMQWSRTFGEEDDDQARDVLQTADGGFIIAGSISKMRRLISWESFFGAMVNTRNLQGWLIRTDESGNELWNKEFGGSGIFGANSVDQTSDGGFILAGMASPSGYGGTGKSWIIRTNAKGSEQWTSTFEDDTYRASFVRHTSDGGYIVTGLNAWLIKINSKGKEEWGRKFRGKGLDNFYSVQEASDGGYIIAGSTQTYGADDGDAWIIKTDSHGNEEWNRTYGTNIDSAFSVQQTRDGGYIIGGWGLKTGIDNEDAWLIKTDIYGIEQWNMTFAGKRSDRIYSVQETLDGGIILAGGSESYGAGDADVWLIKLKGDINGSLNYYSVRLVDDTKISYTKSDGFDKQKPAPSSGFYIAVLSIVILFLLRRRI